jgi:hypothetical protein
VSIIPVPSSPGTISGSAVICMDSIASYSITTVPNATSYSWTVPAGAVILSGQNTTSISIQWGTNGGSISVIAGNLCGNSNPSVVTVSVVGPPAEPMAIAGPPDACNGSTVSFSVDPVANATSYLWTVPTDATILSGQTTDSISVQWGANAGSVSVAAINNCGTSIAKTSSIGLETLPDPAGLISGNDTVCSNNETYTFTVPAITGATSYTWVFPSGISITSGTGTRTIVVSVGPTGASGQISVQGKNTCGAGTAAVKNIVVKVCAGIPVNITESRVTVFPNPAEGVLNIAIAAGEERMDLKIADVSGQIVYREALNNTQGDYNHKIDVSGFSRGVYFVELRNSSRVVIKKIILQ